MRKILPLLLLIGCTNSEEKTYKSFCDAAIPLIQATCQHYADCGFIEENSVQECATVYVQYIIGLRGCGTTLEAPDEAYDECFDLVLTASCESLSIPDECKGIW